MFLIVEIVNDTGEKEWKIAPKRWVCTSKKTQRTVLFWPNEFSIERQNLLAIEGTCKPLQCWMRKECVIRQELPSYETANTELQTLLTKEEPEDPLNVEDPAVKSLKQPCASQSTPDDSISMLVSIKSILESLILKNARIEEQSANISEQNSRIVKEISVLQERVETMERTVVHMTSHQFEPMETMEQLRELDKKLNDESFNAEWVQWLLSNIDDDNSVWRMKSCFDLLCTVELQSKLRWSCRMGSIIKEPKETLPNIVKLFEVVGKTPSEDVTPRGLAKCLTNHLKYSKQRFLLSLNRRRAGRWKRRKKLKRLKNDVTRQQQVDSSLFTTDESSQEFGDIKTYLQESDIIMYNPLR